MLNVPGLVNAVPRAISNIPVEVVEVVEEPDAIKKPPLPEPLNVALTLGIEANVIGNFLFVAAIEPETYKPPHCVLTAVEMFEIPQHS